MPDVGLDSALPVAATWESVARRAVDLTVAGLGLLVLSIPLNLFLAIIFDRYMQFTYDDSFFPNGPN